MFTGIVQDLVPVRHVEREADLTRLGVELGALTGGLNTGASVAVNGTCLTVTRIDETIAWFDVIVETLNTTNLGAINLNDLVNIERSFRIGDEVGGHIVSGHVTATAELVERIEQGRDVVLTLAVPSKWIKYVFHKGFVAVDGASLTVSSVQREHSQFCVSLIPETLARTTLGRMAVGDRANIEVDAQTVTTVDTVERLFQDKQWREQIMAGGPDAIL